MEVLALHCKNWQKFFIKNVRTVKKPKIENSHISVTKKRYRKNSNGFELLGPKAIISK